MSEYIVNLKKNTSLTDSELRASALEVTLSQFDKDAADALRVSSPTILGEYIQDRDNLPLLLDRVNGGTATQVYSSTLGGVTMSVTNNGDYAICQSKQRHKYYAGKSQLVEETFANMTPEAGTLKRQGYFSSNTVAPYDSNLDGIWIESDATTTYLVISKLGTETYRVERSSWNDSLDGNGASGLTLNLNLFNIFVFDFLYLGGSSVQFYFKIGRKLVPFHRIDNSNVGASTMIGSPNQPYRAEIRSTGGAGSMQQICASINTEGSLNRVGLPIPTTLTNDGFIDANVVNTWYMVKGIRINPAFSSTILGNFRFNLLATTNDHYKYGLFLNPTVAGPALTWNAVTNTFLQEADGDIVSNPATNTVTGGYLLEAGYGTGSGGGSTFYSEQVESSVNLGLSINGTPDTLILAVTPVTTNLDIRGSLNSIQY